MAGGKKKSKQQDDYWSGDFESDLNAVVCGDAPAPSAESDAEVKAAAPLDVPPSKAKKGKNAVADRSAAAKSNTTDNSLEEASMPSKKETKASAAAKNTKKQPASALPLDEDAPAAVASAEEVAATSTSSKKASKKPTAAINMIKQMQALRLAAQQEQDRLDQEERDRIAAEEAIQAAELALQEEKRRVRREQEALRKEELRKQGKLLTKAQKERLQHERHKLEQLKAMGVVKLPLPVETADPEAADSAKLTEPRKKPVYAKKKKSTASGASKLSGDGSRDSTNASPTHADASSATAEEDLGNWDDDLSEGEAAPAAEQPAAIAPEAKAAPISAQENTAVLQQPTAQVEESSPVDANLRSPICCILGHVDTGKTKLLDKIRQTNVQEGEAGGITQQIGATYFPIDAIRKKTDALNELGRLEYNVPGLLIIDTPGHASFTNLRSRGSSLCNIAILVVDITAGLEAQTLESIGLLRQRKTPFIVALNKVDRVYDWRALPNAPIQMSLAQQPAGVLAEYEARVATAKLAFSEQGLNAELYYKNKDFRKFVSIVPTSAITGEGIPDLLMLIIQLTQRMMANNLRYLSDTLECTVLEVKVIEGLGTTIDCILSNGVLREGDRIAVCGLNGPIVTSIRAILTPQPLREMRVKGSYVHHKEVRASLGVKLCAPDLEKAIAGSRLLRIGEGEDEATVAAEVMDDLASLLNAVAKSEAGVCVQSSTLGSLEALLQFLADMHIPVSGIAIGPVHKKDVVRASTILERAPEFALILAFDVKIERDAADLADDMGVKIFSADIIYHLFDKFTAHMRAIDEGKRKELAPQAVFPCVLNIVPGCVFNSRDPIILGVTVAEGVLRVGTPLCVPASSPGATVLPIGKVTSIELNHKPVTSVRKGGASVAIKIEHEPWETPKLVGRHFTERDELVSKISRASIDVLKANFRNDLDKDDWMLVVKLKKLLGVQ